ncbi:MAG: EAL domain-containing protein [Ruminococcaceae bacterium]|nr:EAL domain-containing protein [Oscillospiraceae bacterium]
MKRGGAPMVSEIKFASPDLPQPDTLFMKLALAPYDGLLELDLKHRLIRTVRLTEGKYTVAAKKGTFEEVFRGSTEFLVYPDDRETYLRFFDSDTLLQRLHEAETPDFLHTRYRYRLLNGAWHWVEVYLLGAAQTGEPEHIVYSFLFDADEQAGDTEDGAPGESILRSELTGLLWERPFFARAREILREHAEGWCVISIDLEHFKLFNEWYGREQGDQLLAQVGARLTRAEAESGGLACYFGQDDFALLYPYDERRVELLYEQIHGLIVQFGTSVGFLPAFGVCLTDNSSTIEQIYDRASMATVRAKSSYHSRVRVFDPLMYEKADWDYHILSDFQKAMKDHELSFYLQPQCQIATERVVGAESLVRWKKADGKMVSPGVFIPVLEEYGFVTDLDKFVWEEVCKWQRMWIDSGHTPLPISVNVSQIDIFTIDVPAFLEEMLKKYDLPVEVIKVEITESAYVDNGAVADAVKRLREKGFLVLMDDFGSGYSSLNMLRNLNVDVIKLDAQFLRMGGDDRKGIQIVESIVNMAKTMGVPIIVEGVETQQETEFLSGLGCRYVQGYYFYRPMPQEEFQALIADPEHIDTSGFLFEAKDQFHTREFLDQNVFSDAMLNNILGPIAFFSQHGEELDVVRFNRQLLDEVDSPVFQDYTKSIQRLVVQEDLPRLYELLDHALIDPLGGASAVIRFQRLSGRISQFRVQFFFLEEDDNGRRFYGSARDVTQLTCLNEQMSLLTQFTPDSVVLLRNLGGELCFQVAAHGLEQRLGLDRAAFERELCSGAFRERLDPGEREQLLQLIVNSGMRMDAFSPPFRVTAADGTELSMRVRFDSVHDRASGVEYIMLLRLSTSS